MLFKINSMISLVTIYHQPKMLFNYSLYSPYHMFISTTHLFCSWELVQWYMLPISFICQPASLLSTTCLSSVSRIFLFCYASPSVQFSAVAQSSPTLCDPMDCSRPGLLVHHQTSEFTQTHAHWVSDAIQPSHPLSSFSPQAFNSSQHQGLFQ